MINFRRRCYSVRSILLHKDKAPSEITPEASINRDLHKEARERLKTDIEALKTWRKTHYPKVSEILITLFIFSDKYLRSSNYYFTKPNCVSVSTLKNQCDSKMLFRNQLHYKFCFRRECIFGVS